MNPSLTLRSTAIAITLGATIAIGEPSKADSLIDGKYFGPEESFVVQNGKLSKCFIPGPGYGSCSNGNITATQAGPNAIRVKSSWGMNSLKCKGALPAGKNAFRATCTPTGWK